MKKLIALVFGLSVCAPAAKVSFDVTLENTSLLNPECPVELTGVYADPPKHDTGRLSVHFKNQGQRNELPIVAAEFGVAGYDAVRREHRFPHTYAVPVKVAPQKDGKPVWKIHFDEMENDMATGTRVWLVTLMYANGATWEDDGSQRCALTLRGKPGKRTTPED